MNRTLVLRIACLDGRDVDVRPSANRFEGFHRVTTSVQRVAGMPNSRLRNCIHIDVFGRSLGRCIKCGLAAVGLTISVTQANAAARNGLGTEGRYVWEVSGDAADTMQRRPIISNGE